MDFVFTKEEEKVISEVREFIKKESTPELLKETHELERIYGGKLGREFIKKFAANGWLCPNWPEEYGGLNMSEMLTYMIKDEMTYSGIPHSYVAAHYAGATIMKYASDEIKEEFLLPISKGEIEFALGYSEPSAGSDLLGLELRAEDKGDYYLVNGQKTFNTHAHVADYHWLAARTKFDGPKHKGLSMFIVDLDSPGIPIRPMISIADSRTNEVYYDNVKVPKKRLVGEENMGFLYLMKALDYERMFPFGHYRKLFEHLLEYVKETIVDGEPIAKNPLIRQKVAQLATELEAAKLLYYSLSYMLDKGKIPNYQASMEKTFVCDLSQKLAQTGMEILGQAGQLTSDSKWAAISGEFEYYYRWVIVETIYGGTNEIQKNIMAQRGLGLPRA
ncbi:MAG: acyl-CoA dehydrogenase [Desulfobacterales bacterium]|nr:acyl-CoA dehydrogenase [Desulfobacterales bacterium]